jgi:hypothetical protein
MYKAWENLSDIDGFSRKKGEPDYWLDAVRDFWTDSELDMDMTVLACIVKWFDERRKANSINRRLASLRTVGEALANITLPVLEGTMWGLAVAQAAEAVLRYSEGWPDTVTKWARMSYVLREEHANLEYWTHSMGNYGYQAEAAELAKWADALLRAIRNLEEGTDDET